jgi:hypothetical protein
MWEEHTPLISVVITGAVVLRSQVNLVQIFLGDRCIGEVGERLTCEL